VHHRRSKNRSMPLSVRSPALRGGLVLVKQTMPQNVSTVCVLEACNGTGRQTARRLIAHAGGSFDLCSEPGSGAIWTIALTSKHYRLATVTSAWASTWSRS
jgi:hypothetical protein